MKNLKKRIIFKVLSVVCVFAIIITQMPNILAMAVNTEGSIMIDTSYYTLAPNDQYTFKITLTGASADEVTTSSSNPGLLSVAEAYQKTVNNKIEIYYKITAKIASGWPVYITSTVKGASVSMKVVVSNNVRKHGTACRTTSYFSNAVPTTIDLNTSGHTFDTTGKTSQFTAEVSNMTSRPALTSSNPSAVSVRLVRIYSCGYLYELKSLAPGSSTISVSLNGVTKSFTATVSDPTPSSTPTSSSSSSSSSSSTSTPTSSTSSSSSTSAPTSTPTPSTSIKLNTSGHTFDTTGKTSQFTAEVSDMSSRPTLTSSDPSVVSVRLVRIYSCGYLYELKSLALGSSTISLSLNGVTKSFTATVSDPNSSSSSLTSTPSSSSTSTSSTSTSSSSSTSTSASSSTPSSSSSSTSTSVPTSTPTPSTSIKLNTSGYAFDTTGKTSQFTAEVSDMSSRPVLTSSNPSVVSIRLVRIYSCGYLYELKSLAPGSSTISLSLNGVTKSFTATVSDPNSSSPSSSTSTPSSSSTSTSSASTSSSTSTSASSSTPSSSLSSTSAPTSTPTPSTSIKLNTSGYAFDTTGKTSQFTAEVSDMSSRPVLTSSNPSVVSIRLVRIYSCGYLYELKSLAPGSSTISLSLNGVTKSFTTTVSSPTPSSTTTSTSSSSSTSTSTPSSAPTSSSTSTSAPTSSSSSASSSTPTPKPTSIDLNTSGCTFDTTGQTYQFTAEVSDMSSRPILSLSNPSVVSIRLVRIYSSGYLYELKSLALGSSTVSVSLNGVTKSFTAAVAAPDKYAKATTGVNLRSGPSTDYSIYFTVQTGTIVKVLDTSNPTWTKVQTPGGQIGYLCTEYIAFINSSTTSSVSLSNYSGTIPAGKTFYITATTTPADADVVWNTSDANVATVSNGFIYAVAPGTATITAGSGGRIASCKVTVTQAEPVRIAYTYPNIAGVNSNVELTAITDSTRDSARFVVKMNDGSSRTLNATTYTSDGATRVWKASTTFPQAGVYNVTAYSSKDGVMSSTGASTTAFISSTNDFTTTTVEERRVSDKMVDIIKAYEGYSAAVYPDTLAYNIPTIGYGHVVGEGEVFYNNLTKNEATALLINNINERTYTTEVNKFILNNHVKTNQNQFDAMVSFSYNIGAGYWNGTSQFDLKNIMLNGVVPPTIGSGLPATTTTDDLIVRSSASTSASTVATVGNGSNVTVLQVNYNSATKLNWYQIRLASGAVGWVSGAYVRFASSVNAVRDLNYVDATQFGNELLLWHNAGGKPVVGLLYRRLAEAKVFSFGNYAEATPGSANYKHNTYQYTYPPEFVGYEQ